MRELEILISQWRKKMEPALKVGPETLQELENHLREQIESLVQSGLSEPEAFHRAVAELGSPADLAEEFQKVDPPAWLPVQWLTGAALLAGLGLLVLAVAIATKKGPGAMNILLGAHIFSITLGYSLALISGALGICFICHRSWTDNPPANLQSLFRAGRAFTSFAAGLTFLGLLLGAIWARLEWGRYWAWDPLETGGACVLLWLLVLLGMHQLPEVSLRTLMVMSVLGNIVVAWGWFGANFVAGKFGMAPWWGLHTVVLLHLVFVFAAFAPPGWIRTGRTVA